MLLKISSIFALLALVSRNNLSNAVAVTNVCSGGLNIPSDKYAIYESTIIEAIGCKKINITNATISTDKNSLCFDVKCPHPLKECYVQFTGTADGFEKTKSCQKIRKCD